LEFLVILIVLALLVLHFLYWPRVSRAWLDRKPFPVQWEQHVRKRLPCYQHLPESLRNDLQNLIKRFLAKKQFIGCAGLEITDEMRLTIAAQACLLILNRPSYEYEDLRFIYVYPSTFRAVQEVRDEIGLVSTETRDLLGESWSNGKVILAWDEVEHGACNFDDGYNVVLHEFAHQLDHESGATNGAPLLYTRAAYKSWAYVLGTEYDRLRQSDPLGHGIIDDYGASNPAEFFAVATETFFEEPHRMHEHHQALFEQLRDYYHLDPREWSNG
jgi:Mlc titration factor MtfA (ptsG expression regulator)